MPPDWTQEFRHENGPDLHSLKDKPIRYAEHFRGLFSNSQLPGGGVSVSTIIRKAQATDVHAIVAMSEQKRIQYQSYQPLFWQKAADSSAKQIPFLESQLSRDNVIALVHEQGEKIDGFVIATLQPSPPVYAAGLTCTIDDYCVQEHDWDETGKALLDAATQAAKGRGAVQVVVVCGHMDSQKREMLLTAGHSIASEWWVKPIV